MMGGDHHHPGSWLKENKQHSFKLENSASCSDESKQSSDEFTFQVPESDLALAKVPGVDFDPTRRCFSAEELKPQPIIKKRKKVSERTMTTLHFFPTFHRKYVFLQLLSVIIQILIFYCFM